MVKTRCKANKQVEDSLVMLSQSEGLLSNQQAAFYGAGQSAAASRCCLLHSISA